LTWSSQFESLPEIVWPRAKPASAAAIAPAGTSAPKFADYWWGDEWWAQLRNSTRYGDMLATITLPAIPAAADIAKELQQLMGFQTSAEREVRRPEILEENAGPPAYYDRMLFLKNPGNTQTGAILKAVVGWAEPMIMHFKYQHKRARPPQLEPRLRPMVDVPRHPAYPSGHSTQSHLIARVMAAVTGRGDIETALWQAADRIAQNREYAGIHYASDSAAGAFLADNLAPVFLKDNAQLVQRARETEWA
jgi:membrane-associated phospholipid phosphatase